VALSILCVCETEAAPATRPCSSLLRSYEGSALFGRKKATAARMSTHMRGRGGGSQVLGKRAHPTTGQWNMPMSISTVFLLPLPKHILHYTNG